jgi:NAD(P)H-nitrite reductase large subunit
VLFCTGSTPKVPLIEGRNLPNIFTIKNLDDISEIKAAAIKAKKIIIVGSSLNSMEVATLLKKFNKNLEIVVIDKNEAPFQKQFGKEIGEILKNLHEKNGIKFKLENKVNSISEYEKDNEKIKKIYIESCKKEENSENENPYDKRNEVKKNKKDFIFGDMIIFATGDSPNNVFFNF